MNIGSAIEKMRIIKKMSQHELAEKASITQSYLSLIENNKKEPNMKILKNISDSLEVPLPFLLLFSVGKEDVPESKQEAFTLVLPLLKSLLGEYVKGL